jgi:hypothetical protein
MNAQTNDEICHIIARLADVLEGVVRQSSGDEVALRRLDNIRHDTLKLLVKSPA